MCKGTYVIPFGEQQPWMSESPELERSHTQNIGCTGEIHPFFEEHHLIPLVFIAKQHLLLFYDTGGGRVPLGELEKTILSIQNNISGDLFFLGTFQFRERSSSGSFRHPGLLLPKGNYIYILIHVRVYTRIKPLQISTKALANYHTIHVCFYVFCQFITTQLQYLAWVSKTVPTFFE